MTKNISTRKFNLLLYILARLTIIPYLIIRYRIHSKNKKIFKKLKPPFALIPNHVSMFDPPMVNIFVPHRVHFVMSDANLRTKIGQWVYLKLCNVIPKTKAMADSAAVRKIVQLVRKKRVICIFPEGRSSWDGVTHDIFYSTAKLLKLLKIPVVVPLIRGGYLTHPRWARSVRPGKLVIEYKKIFNGPELGQMTPQDIHHKLLDELWHDDYAFQRESGQQFKSRKGAEYLERLLFICPSCHSFNTLHSSGNNFICQQCGFKTVYDSAGLLQPMDKTQPVRTVRDWVRWQSAFLEKHIESLVLEKNSTSIFVDEDVMLYIGHKLEPLKKIAGGTMAMYLDRFTLTEENGTVHTFPLEDVEGVQVLLANKFEFYYRGDVYYFRFRNPRTSGYKYLAAVQKIAPGKTELE